MKSKALNSLKAAQRLVEARETYGYNSSIHCSYYALLQYMKYKLATSKKNPLLYEKQDKKDESSHDYLLMEIKNRINNPIKERKFSEIFKNLKSLRVLADYGQTDITEDESLECKEQAESAIKKLNQYLGEV